MKYSSYKYSLGLKDGGDPVGSSRLQISMNARSYTDEMCAVKEH
jgi:hypothetical protein